MSWYYFEPRPKVHERRAAAIRALEQLQQTAGGSLEPVIVEGRKIAQTFWGQAWCDNLEAYRDFEYRLPRGRSYVRNRAVLDLKIEPGKISAKVHGSSLYDITVRIAPLPDARWRQFKQRSAGRIASLIELLKGELSDHVIQQIIDRDAGLFPAPDEITMQCSCLDWAVMCKHVAAAMYGVGHRLDRRPELLFAMRQLDPAQLIEHAAAMAPIPRATTAQPVLDDNQVADVFGIDLAQDASDAPATQPPSPRRKAKRKAAPAPSPTPPARMAKKAKAKKKSKKTTKTAARPRQADSRQAQPRPSLKKKK